MTTNTRTAARAVADLNKGVVLARVDIAAAPERVFAALTTEELTRWWGGDLYRVTGFTIDLRVGGRWRTDGIGGEGKPFHVEGEVLAVEPPRRLVQTWKASWDAGGVTTIEYTLDPIPSGTRVTVRHEGFAGRPESCQGHALGWERVLEWLGAHVAPGELRYYLLRLIAPRPSFAQDMNADERTIMKEHGSYWRGKLAEGRAIAFGPVLDPGGAWGLGLVAARDEAELRAFEDGDPAIRSGRGFRYEAFPMASLVF